jgi:very-short-patch-repair endonuclease
MKKPTDEEVVLAEALKDEGVITIPQYNDSHKVVDLRSEDAKVDIEVDGQQYLTNPIQINRDLDRSWHSFNDGYATLHVPNKDVHRNIKRVAHAIARALKFRAYRIKFGFWKKKDTLNK